MKLLLNLNRIGGDHPIDIQVLATPTLPDAKFRRQEALDYSTSGQKEDAASPFVSAAPRRPAAVQALIELSWQLSLHDLRLETRKTRETRVRTLPWANSGQVTTDHPGPIDLHLPSQAKSKL